MVLKTCKKCNEELYLTQFSSDKRSKDGLKHVCIDCSGESTRQEKRKPLKQQKKAVKKIEKKILSDEDRYLKKLLTDFPTFLTYSYSYVGLPKATPLQNRIAEIFGENPKRLILQAGRGVGKSYILAIYGGWRLLRNINEKILIVSGTEREAIKISQFLMRLIKEVPLLQHLQPRGERKSVMAFDVHGCNIAQSASVAVAGITGQLTGKRASLIIADDIEIPTNSGTQSAREILLERVKEFEDLIIPDVQNSIIYLGTPQSMESIYSKLPYEMKVLPARVPSNIDIYNGNLDPWILEQGPAGTPTDPIRFSEEILTEKLMNQKQARFMLQYMLDTSLSDADLYPLKQSDLIVYPLNINDVPVNIGYSRAQKDIQKDLENVGFTGDRFYGPSFVSEQRESYDNKVMAIDPAGGGDDTAWVVIGVKNGFVYILGSGAVKGYSDESLLKLSTIAKQYQVLTVVTERNWGGGMFGTLLEKVMRKVYNCRLDNEFIAKGQKELRIIDNIGPLLENHQLVVDYDVVMEDTKRSNIETSKGLAGSLFYQLTHITKDRNCLQHDDRIDALAIACEYVKDSVIINAEDIIKKAEEEEMRKWLHEKVYGSYTKTNRSFLGASRR